MKFDPATVAPDQARWFDPLGRCGCGKAATGVLRGPSNESHGASCQPCAYKRLKEAKRQRDLTVAYDKEHLHG